MDSQPVDLDVDFAAALGDRQEAYERLLDDALDGNQRRFARDDMVEEAWRIVQPVLDDPGRSTSTRGLLGPGGGRPTCCRRQRPLARRRSTEVRLGAAPRRRRAGGPGRGRRRAHAARRAPSPSVGAFCLAVSGGHTPAAMFDHLSREDLPWDRVHVFQVDERVAPDGDPARNLVDLEANLLHRVPERSPTPWTSPHPTSTPPPQLRGRCCTRSAAANSTSCTSASATTATPPPGRPVTRWSRPPSDVAVIGPFAGLRRMTLTPPAVNRARSIVFVVSGAAKRGRLADLLRGDRRIPASRVRSDAVVYADEAAAGP